VLGGEKSILDNLDSISFSLSEPFWLNLQARYDLDVEKEKLNGRIEAEIKVLELRSL
jgi:plasmid maintenance system antidote protein VapI